jgi:hypothetical protein
MHAIDSFPKNNKHDFKSAIELQKEKNIVVVYEGVPFVHEAKEWAECCKRIYLRALAENKIACFMKREREESYKQAREKALCLEIGDL